jgi:hypothetical protein
MNMDIRTVKRVLTYTFTQHEKDELGKELANKNLRLAEEEASKRSVTASFASRITSTKEEITSLSNKLASGYEMRETMCEVQYHYPERNIKQLRRTDTGESWTEPMSDVDFTLWTQFQESLDEADEADEAADNEDEFAEAEAEE